MQPIFGTLIFRGPACILALACHSCAHGIRTASKSLQALLICRLCLQKNAFLHANHMANIATAATRPGGWRDLPPRRCARQACVSGHCFLRSNRRAARDKDATSERCDGPSFDVRAALATCAMGSSVHVLAAHVFLGKDQESAAMQRAHV